MVNLIRSGDFCQVDSDKFVEHGVKRGHLVYVAGMKAFPITEEDPYTQRIKLYVHKMKGSRVLFNDGLYLMDPDSVSKVAPFKQKRLTDELRHLLDGIEFVPPEHDEDYDPAN